MNKLRAELSDALGDASEQGLVSAPVAPVGTHQSLGLARTHSSSAA